MALLTLCIHSGKLAAQSKTMIIKTSNLMDIPLPTEAIYDQRSFFTAAAKTTLELEAGNYQVNITDVEILTWINTAGIKEDAEKWIEAMKVTLKNNKYDIFLSERDPSFCWLSKNGMNYLMYANVGKKEASVYFSRADGLPDIYQSESYRKFRADLLLSYEPEPTAATRNEPFVSDTSSGGSGINVDGIPANLVGNWGNLTGTKVNWRDESTGHMLVSGVSKGYGLELKPDGTFLHTTVVTSGRPNYRVFVTTTGNWSVEGNLLIIKPCDRHYRKWENEIIMIDEHSVPETYKFYWLLEMNNIMGKECLYIKSDLEEEKWDEMCRE